MTGARRSTQSRQRGVVLLSVLLILALLTAIVYQLVGRQSLVVAQARQTFAGDQALEYALGAEDFARQILRQEWLDTGAVDDLTEIWAQPLPPLDVDEGLLEIQVRDLNACFNLNAVASTTTAQQAGRVNLSRFKTLLRNLNLPETIADIWLDWIDPDQEVSGFGAEDGDYLLGEFAHRTADRLAGHVSELRMLRDMDAELYAAIEPYVCVLPTDQLRININTADPQVIAALNPSISAAQIEGIAQGERTYTDVTQVTAELPELAAATDAFGVASEYFEIQIRAQVDDSLVELASTLHRNPNDGTITLLTRDFGKSFRSKFLDELTGSEE